MLSVYADDHVPSAIEAGASGYLVKDITGAELLRAIHSAASGASPLLLSVPTEELPSLVASLRRKQDPGFSPRQLDVLRRVARGASNAEIAQELVLGERTVKRELTEIFRKLGVDNRAEAIAYAYKHQLI